MATTHQLPFVSIIRFNEIMVAPKRRRTLSQENKKFNIPLFSIQCKALPNAFNNGQTVVSRRSANFQPSIWDYDYIQSLTSEYKEKVYYTKRIRALMEEVKVMMLFEVENNVDQLEIINVLQRLGIAYHFNNEIRNILENVCSNMDVLKRKNNLYATALAFRLLRQHGYNISTDVFLCFQEKMGNFKECLDVDVKGLLSLYEASFHSVEGESILDEARDFTSNFLKEFVNKNRGDDTLVILINHALEFPLHWRMPRLEAWWFIDFLCERRQNVVNDTLLQLAKLDFNMVQSQHQEELKYISRWWKRIGLVEELSFVRDRLVENFFWALGMNSRPDHKYFREVTTKVTSVITTIDDIYDVYGTLEELELFTMAVDSWDLNAMDTLPHYMKICFLALIDFVNEIAFVTLKANGYDIIPYLKKAWTDLCKSYLIEAKWYYNGYTPKLQEYMENGWISSGGPVVIIHTYFSVPSSIKMEDLVCLQEEYPDIIRFSSTISRLANDLGACKHKMETGDVSKSIQCYINETGASEVDARKHLHDMIRTTWEKMNEAARNSHCSDCFIESTINFARMSQSIYQYGEGYTVQDHETKSRILSLIMQPIPITS